MPRWVCGCRKASGPPWPGSHAAWKGLQSAVPSAFPYACGAAGRDTGLHAFVRFCGGRTTGVLLARWVDDVNDVRLKSSMAPVLRPWTALASPCLQHHGERVKQLFFSRIAAMVRVCAACMLLQVLQRLQADQFGWRELLTFNCLTPAWHAPMPPLLTMRAARSARRE